MKLQLPVHFLALLFCLPLLGACDRLDDKGQDDDDSGSEGDDDDSGSGGDDDDSGASGDDDDSGSGGDDDDSAADGPFSLRSETTNFTRNQGGSGAQHVYVDREPNFQESVSLSVTNPPSGATITYEPSAVEKDVGIVHIALDATATTGDYELEVVGTADGGDTDTVIIPLTVNPADMEDFALDVSPVSGEIEQGASGEFTVEMQWHGSFTDDADLACLGLPAGMTCSFDNDPVQVNLNETELTVAVDTTVGFGVYDITVEGVAGSQSKTSAVLVSVGPGGSTSGAFTLRSEVTNFSINQQMGGSMTVFIDRTAGHEEEVELTAGGVPTGVTVTFPEAPTAGDSEVMVLDIGASATTGDSTITVTGDDGSATSTADFPLTINATSFSDFALSLDDYSVQNSGGTTASLTLEVQRDSFTDDVALTCQAPSEVSCSLGTPTMTNADSTSSVSLEVDGGATSGVYSLQIEGVGGTINKLVDFQVVVP